MGPSSAGRPPVDRYIGACLVARSQIDADFLLYRQRRRHHHQHQHRGHLQPPFAASRKHPEEANPLAGPPLILTRTTNDRRNRKTVNSATSDESSGSANSDMCLPRVIKPRKRRKKDRKPPMGDLDGGVPPNLINPLLMRNEWSDASETPQLQHRFEDVEDVDEDGVDVGSACQCRYCDPSGQIWDVDRECYSPFLTRPTARYSLFNPDEFVAANAVNNNKDHFVNPDAFALNYLEFKMSTVSLGNEDILMRKPTTSRCSSTSSSSSSSSCRDLEVSTEIVTSLNGHRDIEIKFFSNPNVESEELSAS